MSEIRTLIIAALAMHAIQGTPSSAQVDARCAVDLNRDGVIDTADVSILETSIGASVPRLDLNGSGTVGLADKELLERAYLTCTSCPADVNADGEVDSDDRAILERNYGYDCSGDLNRDGLIDMDDQAILQHSIDDPNDADPRADLNRDGSIDAMDQAVLDSQALNQVQNVRVCLCDFNADGTLDRTDLWFMLQAWGECSPEEYAPRGGNRMTHDPGENYGLDPLQAASLSN